ncbi:hypothetical protein LTR78_001078 [Recurvomyces mirabilis]|uniref:Peptidase A1 domain-containing protein n=1 Tax=Recurvomyces mirabilis TaxID=574656 RepID=A0AAE0WWC4_9PEZI|nr:hypothetical protein LTR78_001078 [Recurvomyces mirabilis]KAK5159050.1 hypothetical protein LTS14_003158 [Recurvomyces mirabilis]
MDEGCWQANPGLGDCASARGGTFVRNQSFSWSTQRLPSSGLLQLNTFEEGGLGLSGNAYYGFETVTLGIAGQNLPTLATQLVAGIATDNYFLGSLGLSPISFNITNLNSPLPSVLGQLRNQSLVPSLSWAYSAGASYRSPANYGSLVFGGYDQSLIASTGVLKNAPFSGDTSRDLQVQLQSITYDTLGSTPLLSQNISVFIDSMVSQLWLPLSVCQNFESAFNLTWDDSQSLYVISQAVHKSLMAQNPTFTFRLSGHDGVDNTSIVLPYAAFNMNATQPLANTTSYYFPLQRAKDDTQYTLGRVFLQEAYIIADYDRQTFSVSPLRSNSAAQKLVPICAPGNSKVCGGGGISGGAIAGIVIGILAVLAIVAIMLWYIRRRSAKAKKAREEAIAEATVDEKQDEHSKQPFLPRQAELGADGAAIYEMDRRHEIRPELPGQTKSHEMGTAERKHEMGVSEPAAAELEAPLK